VTKEALRDLERRLRDEPENLGLRVMVAGTLREAGRLADAVELYRSVAIAYRDQGRIQQAIAVCRSILEIAPADPVCEALLEVLERPSEPELESVRQSASDLTPLPVPLPYHIADPTARLLEKISLSEIDLPPLRPGSEDPIPEVHHDDLAVELDTRRRPRIETGQLAKISGPPPTAPMARVDLEDLAADSIPTETDNTDDEKTRPREALEQGGTLAGKFFKAIPADKRMRVLDRFQRQTLPAGTPLVRTGETTHPLVLVERGVLEVRVDGDEPVTLARVEVGDFYGDATLMSRSPARSTLVTATEADLLVLSARDFYEIASAYPELWKALAARHTNDTESD